MKITFKDGIVIEVKETEGKTKKEIMDEVKIIHKEFKNSQSVKDAVLEHIPFKTVLPENKDIDALEYLLDLGKKYDVKPYLQFENGDTLNSLQIRGKKENVEKFAKDYNIDIEKITKYQSNDSQSVKDEEPIVENTELATLDDWDEFYEDIFPREIKYEDLDIDVVAERVDYSYRGHNEWSEHDWEQPGVIREWYYDLDKSNKDTNELIAKFYKKDVNQITKQDLLNLKDNKKFDDFLYEAFYEEACEDAEKNWEEDDVDWDTYDKGDYDMDHYEDI